jgi:hypothetical protein
MDRRCTSQETDMVNIEIAGDQVTFRVAGLHKLWALKSWVRVALGNIQQVQGPEALPRGWTGWRLPGTQFPGVITAGSFRKDGAWRFWDVVQPANTLVVTLKHHRYAQLVVEVARPDDERRRLQRAIADTRQRA